MDKKILAIVAVVVVVVAAVAVAVAMNDTEEKGVSEGVNYHANGGNSTTGSTVIGYNSHEVVGNVFYKEGYSFQHWNTKSDGTGTSYNMGGYIEYSPGHSVDLYAIWYDGNYLQLTTVLVYLDAYCNGSNLSITDSVTLPSSGSLTVTFKARSSIGEGGYMLDGDKIRYNVVDGKRVTSYTSTVKLTGATGHELALTSDGVALTITFDNTGDVLLSLEQGNHSLAAGIYLSGNGGTDSDGNKSAHTYENQIPITTFTCEGKTFNGWNTAKDGSGTAYKAGDTVEYVGYIMLYAQWI